MDTMRITSKGQVTIPIEIRNRLGLLPHTEVVFEVEDDKATIRRAEGDEQRRGKVLTARSDIEPISPGWRSCLRRLPERPASRPARAETECRSPSLDVEARPAFYSSGTHRPASSTSIGPSPFHWIG